VDRRTAIARLVAIALCVPTVRMAAAQGPPPQSPAPPGAPKLTHAPRLVKFVEAPYPESERAGGRTAAVVLRIGISVAGTVDQVAVVESGGAAFDAAAMQAVRQFVFEPAEVDGKPAAIRILYRYEFVLRAEAPTTAPFDGHVRDRRTRKPLAGVQVAVEGVASATTDAEGAFHLDAIAPGEHAVTLAGSKLTALQTTETFVAGRRLTVTYDVDVPDDKAAPEDRDDVEIVVAAPPLQKEVVSTEVSADQARKVPGTQGDVLKVVENLPGVARAAIGSGQVVVWGAAPQDTRVVLDDVPLPRLYHEGGFRSVVHSDAVRSVDLAPGGWDAEYGRGLGGLLTVRLKDPEKEGVHGSVSADVLDAAADVRARLGERVAVEIAGRKSWLDALVPIVTSRNVGQLVPIPRYEDALARVSYDLSDRERLELGLLLSSDHVDDTVPSDDPTSVQQQTHDSSFSRAWLRWRKQAADGGEITVVPAVGTDSDHLVDRFGAIPTDVDVESVLGSLRVTWRKRLADWVTTTVGVDAQVVSSHYARTGSNTSPPRQGDVSVFGQAPSDQIGHDDGTAVAASAAPFAAADLALAGGALHLLPSIRVEPTVLTVSRSTPEVGDTPAIGSFQESTQVEPRLAVRWSPVRWLTWKAGWGIYHQPPAATDVFPVFGNPTLGLSGAQHLLGGVAVGSPDSVSVEATAFRVSSDDLAVRSPLPSPLLAQALVASGVGRARGVQLLVRANLGGRLFGWLTYTYSKSERAVAWGDPWYPYDFDQTHVLGAVASLDLGHGFEVGGRARYATGYPRTPVVGSYLDVKSGTYQPIFGALNSTRIPDFVQLDLRLSKRFALPHGALEAYLDVQNVTNRSNPEEIVYSPDYTQRRYVTGLPLLPVAGARYSW
jgi:TonB family protein